MDLKDYFEGTKGTGVLSTADATGKVNSALYARPHVMDDGSLALIMNERLSYSNLQSNPKAAYLFLESGPGYKGKRFFLTMLKEDQDETRIEALRRRTPGHEQSTGQGQRHLVFFRIDQERPLVK
jgi:hypothetical protein